MSRICREFQLAATCKWGKLTFMNMKNQPKIAIISMYKAEKGLGLGNLIALAQAQSASVQLYEPRLGGGLPALADFDVLLSSGGPGDPTDLGDWGLAYSALIEAIRLHNQQYPQSPKRAFLICHSFQVMAHLWGFGQISRRPQALWGIQLQIPDTLSDDIKRVFPTTDFYALDSRFYQVMPTADVAAKCAAKDVVITARDNAGALTAWQTRDGHMAAVQFHPEARADQLQKMLNNPPVDENEPIHMCPPHMVIDTQDRLHVLPQMEHILINFMAQTV